MARRGVSAGEHTAAGKWQLGTWCEVGAHTSPRRCALEGPGRHFGLARCVIDGGTETEKRQKRARCVHRGAHRDGKVATWDVVRVPESTPRRERAASGRGVRLGRTPRRGDVPWRCLGGTLAWRGVSSMETPRRKNAKNGRGVCTGEHTAAGKGRFWARCEVGAHTSPRRCALEVPGRHFGLARCVIDGDTATEKRQKRARCVHRGAHRDRKGAL